MFGHIATACEIPVEKVKSSFKRTWDRLVQDTIARPSEDDWPLVAEREGFGGLVVRRDDSRLERRWAEALYQLVRAVQEIQERDLS